MRRLCLLLPLLGALAAPAWADVAPDGEATVAASSAAAVTLTLPAKTTAGANRLGVVSCGWTNETPQITGATWNGVAMTLVDQDVETASISLGAGLLQIIAPATAASDVVVTWDVAATARCVAHSYTGVDQASPISAFTTVVASNTASPITVTVATAADELLVDAVVWTQFDEIPATVGANQTSVMNTALATYYYPLASSQDGADGGVLSWTITGSGSWVTIGASLNADAGGGAAAPPTLLLLGVGP